MNANSKSIEYDKVKRKLKYKMPVTFRWGAYIGFILGCAHTLIGKNNRYLWMHPLIFTPSIGFGLCYNDFYRIYNIYSSEE